MHLFAYFLCSKRTESRKEAQNLQSMRPEESDEWVNIQKVSSAYQTDPPRDIVPRLVGRFPELSA